MDNDGADEDSVEVVVGMGVAGVREHMRPLTESKEQEFGAMSYVGSYRFLRCGQTMNRRICHTGKWEVIIGALGRRDAREGPQVSTW